MDLVTQVYNLSEHLPKSEDYILSSQIKRAAISIPSNISEGWARKSNKAFANFLKNSFRLTSRSFNTTTNHKESLQN